MNTVNRILLAILLLVAIPLCTILLVLPVPVLEAAGWQLAALVNSLELLDPFVRVSLGILFALALDIIFVLLIILEVRRPTPKAIRVEKTAGGEVLISVASIADRLKYEVDQLSGVLRSKSKVSAKRSGVVVELDVEMAAGINVPEKADQIVEAARQVVEEKMGLKLARPPKVNLRAIPYPTTPSTPKRGLPAASEPE
ncbi:MAG: alkaline shock response membrane anchor protein AmaP [Anaerolineae bacterium]|nr:alkaline shock response membrane anchor protein AmaP [Anaerolineae bacterium]